MLKIHLYMLIFVAIFMVVGCSSNKGKTITLNDKYSNELKLVNKIIITDGSSGEKREIDNQKEIMEWIDQVKNISLQPLPNQEKRDGFLYSLSFFENDEKLFVFSLGYIDKVYYQVDDQMLTLTTELFEKSK